MDDTLWDRLSRSEEIKNHAEKLAQTTLLLIGCGGLGSEVALKLAGCRIGRVHLIDGDTVSEANIPHSSIFRQHDIGRHKVAVLADFLTSKFPRLAVIPELLYIQQCPPQVFAECDLIVCAPDNDQTRLWVNYYAMQQQKPVLFLVVAQIRRIW